MYLVTEDEGRAHPPPLAWVDVSQFDAIDYESHVHINYAYLHLYSTCLLTHFQLVQLCHRVLSLRIVYHGEKGKPSVDKELPELLDRMHECEELLLEFGKEFAELMDIVRKDSNMIKDWNSRNCIGGAYQHRKCKFEHEITRIIAEREINGSYAAR